MFAGTEYHVCGKRCGITSTSYASMLMRAASWLREQWWDCSDLLYAYYAERTLAHRYTHLTRTAQTLTSCHCVSCVTTLINRPEQKSKLLITSVAEYKSINTNRKWAARVAELDPKQFPSSLCVGSPLSSLAVDDEVSRPVQSQSRGGIRLA